MTILLTPMKATLEGKVITTLPEDLFIPPDALEVFLDDFTGPLDLLLYLIRKQNLDILNIPITLITDQYMQYIHFLEHRQLALAADYLLMAALLAEIKSRCLLPIDNPIVEEEADPRLILVEKLQRYEQFKLATDQLEVLPRCERDIYRICLKNEVLSYPKDYAEVSLDELLIAMQELIKEAACFEHHRIDLEPLSVRERMAAILMTLEDSDQLVFTALLKAAEGRSGIVVTFLAVLELVKEQVINLQQSLFHGPIFLSKIFYAA